MTEQEILVGKILKENTGIDVASLYTIKKLPEREYLVALAFLDSVMETEIPDEVRCVTKLCFSDPRARLYYRRIFRWWMEARGDTAPPNLEYALLRTYSKSQCEWTWETISGLPTATWPFTVVRKMWKHCIPKDEGRVRLLELLNNGERAIWKLIEISKIDDPALRKWFLECGDLPRDLQRRVKRWPEVNRSPVRLRVRRTAPTDGFREIFSADVDETVAGQVIASLSEQLRWPNLGSLGDLDEVPHHRFVVVWEDPETSRGRMVVAMREEETTLIVRWLERRS
jgi:hypothetical protein